MAINRRQLTKMFALSPFWSFGLMESLATATPTPCGCVSVLLHGLFFLEPQNGMLLAASPEHIGHCIRYRDHGDPLGPLRPPSDSIVDLTGKLTPAAAMPPFAPELLQFKAAANPFIDLSKQYGLLLKLPYPQHIFSLRSGGSGAFHPNPANKITKALQPYLGARIGVITWLQYAASSNSDFVTRSYYAEHGSASVPYTEVNKAFGAAQNVFSEFDLRLIKGEANAAVDRDLPSQLPSEINPDDERALAEMTINNCATFDAHASTVARPSNKAKAQRNQTKGGGTGGVVSVEVATCPQFGILH